MLIRKKEYGQIRLIYFFCLNVFGAASYEFGFASESQEIIGLKQRHMSKFD